MGVAEHNGLALDRQYIRVIEEKDFQREQGARKSKHSRPNLRHCKKVNADTKQKALISRVKFHTFFLLSLFRPFANSNNKKLTSKKGNCHLHASPLLFSIQSRVRNFAFRESGSLSSLRIIFQVTFNCRLCPLLINSAIDHSR